jgi:hypothetical protein
VGGAAANPVYGEIHGLETLPVIPFKDGPRTGTRDLAAVNRYFGDRPLAWVDDEPCDDRQT